MTKDELETRIAEMPRYPQPNTAWLSFVDPRTGAHLGVILVDNALHAVDAIQRAHEAKANPGGQVLIRCLQTDEIQPELRAHFATIPRLSLLTKADLEKLGVLTDEMTIYVPKAGEAH